MYDTTGDRFDNGDYEPEMPCIGDDCSEYDGSEYDDEPSPDLDDEPSDFRDAVEADADTLRMIGHGTDEDYGYYGDE